MAEYREFEENELEELKKNLEQDEIPRGWRPSLETIEAIQGQKDTHSEGEWIDQGIQNVPVDQVDLSDSPVKNSDDFRKVSHDEMVEGFRKLQEEVQPAAERGADGNYFSQMDEVRGLDYEHGYQRVYDGAHVLVGGRSQREQIIKPPIDPSQPEMK
jgi:hypothetical protein